MKASEKSFDMSRISGTSKGTKVMVENSELYDENFTVKFKSRNKLGQHFGLL